MIHGLVWIGFLCWLPCFAAAAQNLPALTTAQPDWLVSVKHTPKQPRSGEPVRIIAQVAPELSGVTLQCQLVEPGAYVELKDRAYQSNWVSFPMEPGKRFANGRTFSVELSGSLQKNRRLFRYRFTAVDAKGRHLTAPLTNSPSPNFAYFVYDGVPAWKAAINSRSSDPQQRTNLTFEAEAMRRVQAYHLIGRKTSIENVTWKEQTGGKEYKYTGTLVADGMVYDHVRYRARGGVWRYAMGKNMWKFDLPSDHHLQAQDDFGNPYPVPWSKVNLRSCIQQGNYGHRGEQGMFEAVGFRLFNLAGVAAPRTHWIQLRIVTEVEESTADQYAGDFWGLYLAIENEDKSFLKTHGLPDGNIYKMAGDSGGLSHHGAGAATNRSDLDRFLSAYTGGNPSEEWWRANLNLASYDSYRAICECIHHYDISDGKNYDYYLNPLSQQWQVLPWDIDLTWSDNMYGGGEEPFKSRVLSRPVFGRDYQNRLREIRDLLFNPEQAGQVIDECASVIWDSAGAPSMVEADRRKWDYHPVMAMGGQAGQGLFYQAAPSKDFAGMIQLMKKYVKTRGAWIDANLLRDRLIPATPLGICTGPAKYPANNLRFRASSYQGSNNFAAAKWRLAEITPTNAPPALLRAPRLHEITPIWESAELASATNEVTVPSGVVKAGQTYRARVRMKDSTGRWSHWSPPIEFVAGR